LGLKKEMRMKKTYDQIREEKIKKLKGFLFSLVVNKDNVDRMPFRSIISYAINTFKLGLISKKDYNHLYRYFYRLKTKRKKLVEEKRISEEFLILLYKKLQNDEITHEYVRKVLNLVKPYLGNARYKEWEKIISNLKKNESD
jgi:hypothetical protein